MLATLAVALAVQSGVAEVGGARTPSIAADGRIAISVRGDLWVMAPAGGASFRVTTGPAWDAEPAWSPDGAALVFASDRSGSHHIWRIGVGATGPVGGPEQLTRSNSMDSEPTVAVGGDVIFVRGRGPAADLWRVDASGIERRLTSESGAERSPAASPNGGRLAYIADRAGTSRLRIRETDGQERELSLDAPALRPAWSADGMRIAWGTRGRRPGVWVTDVEGRYTAQASLEEGSPAWQPDGAWLIVAAESAPDVGYNGDPDRLGGRSSGDVFDGDGGLRRIRVPSAPDAGAEPVRTTWSLPRPAYNADAFDRVWSRVATLYYDFAAAPDTTGSDRLLAWRDAARRHRPGALGATSQESLDSVIHALVAERPPLRASARGRAGVSSAHPLATAAGIEILEAGGNVVDAAVAVSFALGVAEPDASGMGGYGEALIHLAGMTEPTAIEFMTRVAENATPDNLLLRELPPDGPMLANVPGVVAGMDLAWRKYGRLPWARLLEPAIRIAENGFEVDDAFATTLRREWESFAKYPSSRELFFRDGRPLQAGDTLRNPDLAATLREVATGGADAFYRGSIARTLVEDLARGGNPMSLKDMALYNAAERAPVRTTYRDHTVYSGPPPVTGGVGLIAKLNLLEQAEPGRSIADDAAKLHAMIEAWKLQPSTGGRIADPDMWPVDVTPFESKDSARVRWTCFDPSGLSTPPQGRTGCRTASTGGAPPPDEVGPCDDLPAAPPCRSTGTTAFAVADADGNVVAVTQTLGTWGGNFYVTPGLGFIYNDKLTVPRPGGRGFGGTVPFARVGTVIAPTLVFRGTGGAQRPLAALGAAGNAWISSALYEMVVGIVDHGLGPQQALELPRFLPGARAGPIQIEDGFSPAALRELEAIGHRFRRISLRGELRMGYGAAVVVGDGHVTAGADPRRSGYAAATSR